VPKVSPAPSSLQSTPASTNDAESSAPAPAPAPAARGAGVLPLEKSKPVTIPKFETAPVVDGNLNEPVWQSAAVLKDFYQIDPGDNAAPSKPTEVLLGYDSKFLSVAFRAFAEPEK